MKLLKYLRVVLLVSALLSSGVAGQAWAQSAAPPDPALSKLRSDFAEKIGRNLEEANLYLAGAGKVELAERRAQTQLPDNEPLLLHATVGQDKAPTTQDIYSLKRDRRLLLSLSDFFGATGIPITVNGTLGTAAGSYVRKSQGVLIDGPQRQITISGKAMAIDPRDISLENNDILLSTDALEKWFGLDFAYDFANLAIQVNTLQPLPVEEAYRRKSRLPGRDLGDTEAVLPYNPQPYSLISLPYIDANIFSQEFRRPDSPAVRTANYSVIFNGDLAGFTAEGFVSGTDQKPYVGSVRGTLGKRDADGNLLGPLHATAYNFGDVDTLSQPLIGGGGQEQGITLGNRPLNGVTTRTTAPIRGDAQPGFDVELYRNDIFIDIRNVGVNGQYDFGEVDLVPGNNVFRLVFSGPQGESREELRNIGVSADAVGAGKGYYAASLSRSNITTFEKFRSTALGTGDPHLSANYQYGLGRFGTAEIGIGNSNDQGVSRTLAQAGLASYFAGTFVNANLGYDASNDAMGVNLTARRNFGKQSVLLQYLANSADFNPVSLAAGASVDHTYRAGISGPIPFDIAFFKATNYNLDASYSELYNGSRQLSVTSGGTTRLKSILLSTGSQYTKTTAPDGTVNEVANGNIAARGFIFGGSWRLTAQYQTMPLTQFTEAIAEYDRPISETLDSTTQISYRPDPAFTTASVGLNWQTSRATISPSLQVDSAHNVTAAVNVHFGIAADPFSYRPDVYNKYLAGTGGVAARVFQDKNGSGVYDDGDVLLPDVQIKALQGQRTAVSDARGIAFIPDLEQNRLTDIVVNASTSDDSFGISLFDGAAIRPRPGAVMELEFPIVEAGEMDGQADYIEANGASRSARNLQISLIAPDGRVEKTVNAAADGYWAVSGIRPGIYYLNTDAEDGQPGFMIPRLIEFKVDGSNYFGEKVKMAYSNPISFKFSSENAAPDGPRHTRVIRPGDIAGQKTLIKLGPFHSRLAMTLAWYKLKLHSALGQDGFILTATLAQSERAAADGAMTLTLRPKTSLTLEQAVESCRQLGNASPGCSVELVTTYKDTPIIARPQPIAAPDREAPALLAAAKTIPQSPDTAPQIALPGTPLIVVRPKTATDTTAAVIADLRDYAAANPTLNKDLLKTETVILNLGSYNSRTLMGVMWYKIKTHYSAAIGNARLLVQPSQSGALAQTGKYVLRAALPVYDVEDAGSRCRQLQALGQACTVEILPAGMQSLTAVQTPPKG